MCTCYTGHMNQNRTHTFTHKHIEGIFDGIKEEIFLNEFKDKSGRGHSDVTVSQLSRCFELVSPISINTINGSSDDSKHDITSFYSN